MTDAWEPRRTVDVGPGILRAIAMIAGTVLAIVSAYTGVDGLLLATAGAMIGLGVRRRHGDPR